MEDYPWGGRGGEWGKRVQGIRSIIGRYKIDRGRLRIVMESQKPKNLICITHGHELMLESGRVQGGGGKRGVKKSNGTTVIA